MLHVSKHPLVGDCMAELRDKRTGPDEFRALSRKVISLLLYEATADLPVRKDQVETPLGPAEVVRDGRGEQEVGLEPRMELTELVGQRRHRHRVLEETAEIGVVSGARAGGSPPLRPQLPLGKQPV